MGQNQQADTSGGGGATSQTSTTPSLQPRSLISAFIIVLSCVDLIVVRKVEKDIQTQINKPGHKSATRATCQVTGKRSQIPLWIPPTKSFCLVAVTLGKSALHRI